ncbi:MAG: haloacid dehalogenase-like hydrolase [Verrucomicrobiales bacterium]|nr:haloacid dehalogenase-like hydrolase [Verrucomicrobiales bacterium]
MIRLVLYDIDGTLIASGGAGVRAFAAVARSTFGISNGTAHLNFAGRTDLSIIREFFLAHEIRVDRANFDRFLDDYVFWLDHFLHQLPGRVLPGVLESIETLRRLPDGPLVGLLTGNIRLGAEIKLRHYRLWDPFEVGAFADDHEDRDVIAAIARDRAIERLRRSISGEEILVIGDTPLDIRCARAIGARCLAVATGGVSYEDLLAHHADWTVRSLNEVDLGSLCDARLAISPGPGRTRA